MFVYVATDDIDATLDKAESLGGKTVIPKTEIPNVGWFGFFTDPTGNMVGLFTGQSRARSKRGEIVHKDLSVRVHECPHCGLVLDRDENAALNILARGLACVGSIPTSSLLPGPCRGLQSL